MSGAARLLALYGPLVLIGFTAALVRALGRRLPPSQTRSKGRLTLLWIVLVVVVGPLWIFLAAGALGL